MFTKHFPSEFEIYGSNKQQQKMNTIKTDTQINITINCCSRIYLNIIGISRYQLTVISFATRRHSYISGGRLVWVMRLPSKRKCLILE